MRALAQSSDKKQIRWTFVDNCKIYRCYPEFSYTAFFKWSSQKTQREIFEVFHILKFRWQVRNHNFNFIMRQRSFFSCKDMCSVPVLFLLCSALLYVLSVLWIFFTHLAVTLTISTLCQFCTCQTWSAVPSLNIVGAAWPGSICCTRSIPWMRYTIPGDVLALKCRFSAIDNPLELRREILYCPALCDFVTFFH